MADGVLGGRQTGDLARPQIELAGVDRALDTTVLHPSLGQGRGGVGARVVERPEGAVGIVQDRDVVRGTSDLPGDRHALSFGDVGGRRDLDAFGHFSLPLCGRVVLPRRVDVLRSPSMAAHNTIWTAK